MERRTGLPVFQHFSIPAFGIRGNALSSDMPLDPQQQAEVDRLVSERVAELRDRERLRLWFWLSCLGLVLALVIGGGIALVVREIGQMRQQVAQQAAAFEAAQQEYQRQLAHDRAMQAERAAAAKAVGYQANQSAPAYNANLLRGFIDFMGKSGELRERLQKLDGNDPEDLERFAGDLEKVLHQGLGTLGQVVLRNTEPAPAPGPEKPAPAPVPATQKPAPAAQ